MFHYKAIAPAVFLLLGIAGFRSVSAQTPFEEAQRHADVPPVWPGCDPIVPDCTRSRLSNFIAANLQMPPEARTENAGGVVLMEFVIEKNGTIGEVRPLKDPGMGLGAEATRVLSLMKAQKIKWVPASSGGKRVAFRYTVPVAFNLGLPPKETPQAEEPELPSTHIYDVADVMPKFAGCEAESPDSVDCTFVKILAHVRSYLTYPEAALENKVQGQVVVEYIIAAEGHVTDAKIIQSLESGCDEEALRVVNAMPVWSPGIKNGKPVPVRMRLPVLFQLPKE